MVTNKQYELLIGYHFVSCYFVIIFSGLVGDCLVKRCGYNAIRGHIGSLIVEAVK